MFDRFINRPVLATVISVFFVLLGLIGISQLPLTQFPDIAPPSVSVSTSYPGASAETIARSVAPSLEEAINGVEDMTYMTSTSSNDGSLNISVFFKLGTDPDQAAVNVQNRVSRATSQLPEEVRNIGVTTSKKQNSMIMLITLYSDDPDTYDATFLQNYAKINLIPEIQRVNGVGQASVFGSKDYSMRIWLEPSRMAAYRITPQEVISAVQNQNLEAAPGRFGEGSREALELIIRYKGKMKEPSDYEGIVLRVNADGSLLRLRDIARVELGSYSYAVQADANGKESVTMAIYQSAGSNSNDIQIGLQAVLEKASASFPHGIGYMIPYSTKRSLDKSIDQVLHTLFEAFLLVFLVVFIFLQDFRSTLIPALAVPVAIIGTFFFMTLFGFSINLLTLFALILAIGIVVDDAIVIVEAVHAKMEHNRLPARKATHLVMSEITGAIISITLVMASVFLPVGFLEGSTGVFYRQFAFTLAIAILISAVNALTLSPALCALFLTNEHIGEGGGKTGWFKGFERRLFKGFNTGFGLLNERYVRTLGFLIRRKWLSLGGLVAVSGLAFWMAWSAPSGFIPDEDNGFFIISASLPPGASLDRTIATLDKVEGVLEGDESVETVIAVSGIDLITSSSSPSAGLVFVSLKDAENRGPVKDIGAIMGRITGKLSSISEGTFFPIQPPTVPGFGNVGGLEVVLQDRTSGSLQDFTGVADGYIGALMQRPEIAFAFTMFNTAYPQYELEVDNVKASQLGVDVKDLLKVMQAFYGSLQVSDFNRFGKYYRVVMQARAEDRTEPSSLEGVFVKNASGEMVPMNSMVKLKRVYGPQTVDHFNLFNALTVNASVAPGYTTGQAIKAAEEVALSTLPAGFSYDWKGVSREEIESGGQSVYIFILSLIFVYLLLSAQYESYILPLAVIFSIPSGIVGIFAGIRALGIENNIYVQVAMIMLIGLLAKNAILIVEYAIQRRRAGMPLLDSAIEGSRMRFRPILMTSLAFVVGLLPLLWASGPSALGNHSIGAAAVGGMLSGVFLGVLIIPVLYMVFQGLQEKISGPARGFDDDPLQEE
ncbi:hydrophobe/amphiphile efflux-1 family RND transporter [Prosthecochloris sp. ZM]|uniref:efflux RND transporter permease subunit n=1 Tax=Prosthecochloris sp. ZM TaxID=2283143 RepID=UPI000DF7BF2B|nr:efflux RND transporter permease subunit [Prosthecochloris sp. ZM]RDD30061.1 hydrophobe/amphiphile efflux-1 family RND transporter [Prosthecochloris sp. ZM]